MMRSQRTARVEMFVVLLASVLLVPSLPSQEKLVGCGGKPLYSTAGRNARGGASIWSPDGKKQLAVEWRENADETTFAVYTVLKGKKKLSARLNGFNAEVVWSPDSSAFAVNQREGGGGIGQRAYVYHVTQQSLRKLDISSPVEKAFDTPVNCEIPVPPNTAVLRWLSSNRVLVVAQVVPVSVCKCSGTFMTYDMLLPEGRILRSYTQAETRKQFGDSLGCELKQADDNCAKSWQREESVNRDKSCPAVLDSSDRSVKHKLSLKKERERRSLHWRVTPRATASSCCA